MNVNNKIIQTLVLHRLNLSWQTAFVDSIVTNTILALAGYITQNTYRFYKPGSKSRLYRFSYAIVLTIVCMSVTKFSLQHANSSDESYIAFLEASMPIRTMFSMVMISFVTILSWLWYFMQDQEKLNTRKDDAEKLLRDAELSSLKLQLQPHFLFNSLNSINALIGSRPQEARKMVQQLSDFLRGTIKKEETQWVTLQEELQYLQLYLDIEKVRFGNRLTTEVETDEDTMQLKLPALLLQPIMENAIKFGLYDTIGETVIRLYASREENNLVIRVLNPFDPETSSPKQGIGFGLKSIQRRLYLLFARTDLLTTDAKQNIFTTIVKIPQVPDTI